MSFGPGSFRGAGLPSHPGQIDYRLVRQRTVDEHRRGRLSRLDVCDAQPELLRAARNAGRNRVEPCPICDQTSLVLVTFVFGAKLPRHGRCITTQKEMQAMARRLDEVTCYVVEVCPECSWNHLLRTFPLGGRGRLSAGGKSASSPKL
ncbi:MAG: DUF5318 domain-containing protein [Actinobacteria bacterium]|nr:DUF5318 domain-containing protein [Actinomycetota bacterium]